MTTPSEEALRILKRENEKDAEKLEEKEKELHQLETKTEALKAEVAQIKTHQAHVEFEAGTMQQALEQARKKTP